MARISLTGNPQLSLNGRIQVLLLLENSPELLMTLASLFDFNWSLQINKIVKSRKKGKWQESGTYKEGEIGFWKTNCRMKNCGQNRRSVDGP